LGAWRGLERFDGRSSLQVWLYRIATNRCRNAQRDKGRRPRRRAARRAARAHAPRRADLAPAIPMPPRRGRRYLARPEARYELKEAVSLAFVAASSSCRRDTGRCSCCARYSVRAAEVAEMLETSEAAVKGALQRARA
jgi:DNA-directed RNA polymerase specialized sigma24 family protein